MTFDDDTMLLLHEFQWLDGEKLKAEAQGKGLSWDSFDAAGRARFRDFVFRLHPELVPRFFQEYNIDRTKPLRNYIWNHSILEVMEILDSDVRPSQRAIYAPGAFDNRGYPYKEILAQLDAEGRPFAIGVCDSLIDHCSQADID